ncbi:hypothetical protein EJ03DRAFT_185872 [Teratosphaeria nubilosa]|uniref:Uncharacterized protein n=1 Tax=Teratosphaeria nubilosa TaxID=161662 RepID=A0A6G1LHX9_9PEZI|nr:hypothetical protein EJ03DRAFT_185872 [Teratosphaeria nubilosa]
MRPRSSSGRSPSAGQEEKRTRTSSWSASAETHLIVSALAQRLSSHCQFCSEHDLAQCEAFPRRMSSQDLRCGERMCSHQHVAPKIEGTPGLCQYLTLKFHGSFRLLDEERFRYSYAIRPDLCTLISLILHDSNCCLFHCAKCQLILYMVLQRSGLDGASGTPTH